MAGETEGLAGRQAGEYLAGRAVDGLDDSGTNEKHGGRHEQRSAHGLLDGAKAYGEHPEGDKADEQGRNKEQDYHRYPPRKRDGASVAPRHHLKDSVYALEDPSVPGLYVRLGSKSTLTQRPQASLAPATAKGRVAVAQRAIECHAGHFDLVRLDA